MPGVALTSISRLHSKMVRTETRRAASGDTTVSAAGEENIMANGQGGTATAREAPQAAPAETVEQRLATERLEPMTTHPDTKAVKIRVNEAAGPADEEVARRAYELYLARGGDHGFDMDDWIQAESELRDKSRT
jgi:hypothetical protein